MSRLQFGYAAMVRAIQIGKSELTCFVEGKSDQYFYSQLLQTVSGTTGPTYEIRTAIELTGSSGGKQPLLSFFSYLRRNKLLKPHFGSHLRSIVFCLDKDMDDRKRILKRSDHVIYTNGYDFETYLFANGDIGQAAAIAARIDIAVARTIVGVQDDWRRKCVVDLCDWLALGLLSVRCGASPDRYFGPPRPGFGSMTGGAALRRHIDNRLKLIAKDGGLALDVTRTRFGNARRDIFRMCAASEHDTLFKGRWYAVILEQDIKRNASTTAYQVGRFVDRVLTAIHATVDFDGAWADNYRRQLLAVSP